MILDGVLYSVIHLGRVILHVWSSPFSSVFSDGLQTPAVSSCVFLCLPVSFSDATLLI